MYSDSDCLVSSHNIIRIPDCQFVTVDDDVTGWLTNPGCFLWLKEATATSLGQPLEARVSEVQRVLLATFSNTLTRPLGSLARRFLTSTHLAPSFVSRGGTAIQ